MIVVVVLFVICWLPHLIIVFLQLFGSMNISLPVMSFIGCLVQSYSGLNPFIYLTFNRFFDFVLSSWPDILLGNYSVLLLDFKALSLGKFK